MYVVPPCRNDEGKFFPRSHDGVYRGFRMESGEELVGTPGGVFKVRSLRRKPAETRWSREHTQAVKGSPWKPYQFTENDRLQARLPMPPADDKPVQPKSSPEDMVIPRSFRIERSDIQRFVVTHHCKGCLASRQ